MQHILISAAVGAVFMYVMAHVPILNWVNLLFGFWYFIGGLMTAVVWGRLAEGRRGVMACLVAGTLAGCLFALAVGGPGVFRLVNGARSWHQEEFFQEYPDRDMTTLEMFDYWNAFLVNLRDEIEQALEQEAGAKGPSVTYGNKTVLDLAKHQRKLAEMRDDYVNAKNKGQREFMDWMFRSIHGLLRDVKRGNPWSVVLPILGIIFLYYGFLICIGTGGALLGGLLTGSNPPPEPAVAGASAGATGGSSAGLAGGIPDAGVVASTDGAPDGGPEDPPSTD